MLFVVQLLLDKFGEHVDSRIVMSALWHDDIRESLAWFDELLVHGFEYALVAFDDLLGSTPALEYISFHNTDQAIIGISVHEYFEVHLRAHFGFAERHNSLHHNDFFRLNMDGLF